MVNLNYRIFLINSLARFFAFPTLTLYSILRLTSAFLGHPPVARHTWLLYAASIPVFWTIRVTTSRWLAKLKAWRLGVNLAPVIDGKWPGNIDIMLRIVNGLRDDYFGNVLDEILDEGGVNTARISLLWDDRIFTRDPQVVKHILGAGFTKFEKGPDWRLMANSFFGNGVFASNGSLAKSHRALARPYFTRDRVSDFQIFHQHTDQLLSIFHSMSESKNPCDVQDLFSRFSLDTAADFLFGAKDTSSMLLPLPRSGSATLGARGTATNEGGYGGFAQAFDQALANLGKRMDTSVYAWTMEEFFKDTQEEPMKVISQFVDPMIQGALEAKRRNMITGSTGEKEFLDSTEERTFLDHLVHSTDDVQLIKEQLINVMVAARDTTACLLAFSCYLLAKHPEVMKRLRHDILERFGTDAFPTHDTINQIPYLRAVINETLRLFPPVPINVRASTDSTIIPTQDATGPILIPGGNIGVFYNVMSFQKRKDLWGDDADEFIPDRWLRSTSNSKETSSNTRGQESYVADVGMWMPFHSGPRVCLGEQFAYNEASFVLIRLLQQFDRITVTQANSAPEGGVVPSSWKGAPGRKGVDDVWPLSAITLFSKGGLWLQLHAAEA